MAYKIICETCGTTFEHCMRHTKTCSEKCRKERHNKIYGINITSLPTNFVGRLNEYKVMIDLGVKGYDVYFSAFPQQKYDIVARKRDDGHFLIVEVKTGYRALSGTITKPKHRHNDWDLMAIVIGNGDSIVYLTRDNKETNI